MIELTHIAPGSTLADLPSHDCRVPANTLGSVVAAALQRDADLPGVIVTRPDGAAAIVSRVAFFQQLSLQFSREIR